MTSIFVFLLILLLTNTSNALIRVTSPENDGENTLRAALFEAEKTGSPIRILVPEIIITKPLAFSSRQPLNIQGRGVIINLNDSNNYSFRINDVERVSILNVTLKNSGIKIVNNNQEDYAHSYILFSQLHIRNSKGHGIHVHDATKGPLTVSIYNSSIGFSGAIGLYVSKYGNSVKFNTFNINLFNNGTSVNGDNVQISQGGDGHLIAQIDKVTSKYANEDGIEIEETGWGGAYTSITRTVSAFNGEENIEFSEKDEGNLQVIIDKTSCYGFLQQDNDRNDGIEVREENNGWFNVVIKNTNILNSQMDGIRLLTGGLGDAYVRIENTNIINSGDEGIDFNGRKFTILNGKTILDIINCKIKGSGHNSPDIGNMIKAVSGLQGGTIRVIGNESDYHPNHGQGIDRDNTYWNLLGLAEELD